MKYLLLLTLLTGCGYYEPYAYIRPEGCYTITGYTGIYRVIGQDGYNLILQTVNPITLSVMITPDERYLLTPVTCPLE